MIVDAGGGTVDISTYAFMSASPISVEEVTSPDCRFPLSFSFNESSLMTSDIGILHGSTRVNVRAERFLKGTSRSLLQRYTAVVEARMHIQTCFQKNYRHRSMAMTTTSSSCWTASTSLRSVSLRIQ